jgi:hypothetical protein
MLENWDAPSRAACKFVILDFAGSLILQIEYKNKRHEPKFLPIFSHILSFHKINRQGY